MSRCIKILVPGLLGRPMDSSMGALTAFVPFVVTFMWVVISAMSPGFAIDCDGAVSLAR